MKIISKNSNGSLVKLLQLTLEQLGLYSGNIDGDFGSKTEAAVMEFQKKNNLNPDGVVGIKTWETLLPYITVPTTIPYSYDILTINIQALLLKYDFIFSGTIGLSSMMKEIPYIKIGKGEKQLLYVAGTHANEWLCCPLLMKWLENYAKSYNENGIIAETNAKDTFDASTIYIIPMLNPDAIDLVVGNIDKKSLEYINAKTIADSYPNIRFPDGWKANINGIDLNLQFPARWEQAKEIKYSEGFSSPAPRDFVGNYPLQAPEAIALYDFTINNKFEIMLTYHSQGEVIYWKYLDYNPPNALRIAKEFAKFSGYYLSSTPYASSFAGYKDWFIQNYNLPGYTIEVGSGTNPLPLSQFNKIYMDNYKILTRAHLI